MNKKVLLLLTVGAGVVAATSLLKTERLNKEDCEKVDEYKKFLEDIQLVKMVTYLLT